MTVQNPPLYLQTGSHPAEDVRRYTGALVFDTSGVIGPTDMTVTQNGTPNMSVIVSGGRAFIAGTENTYQGTYFVENRGNATVALSASDPTNARYDMIIARVRDSSYSGVTNSWALEVVQGTPAASPVEPATPANSLVLARVLVTSSATTITNASITDRRKRYVPRGGVVVCTSSLDRPASPYEGMVIYETSTDRALVYNGTAWVGLGAAVGIAPQFYTGAYAGNTINSSTAIITQNNILTAPYPLTMLVTVHGDAGASGGTPLLYIGVRDESGNIIQTSSGALNGGFITAQIPSAGAGGAIALSAMGKKDYTAGQTCGFRVMYYTASSNAHISISATVQFFPKIS